MEKKAIILYVEDNEMDIELTLNAFAKARFNNDVHVVRTGEEALDYLHKRDKYAGDNNDLPDLILLDIHLPGMSGLDVLKEIKHEPVIKRIPVIILTSSKEESDRIMGYDNHVNSYLVKPISFAGFVDIVSSINHYWMSLNINASYTGYDNG